MREKMAKLIKICGYWINPDKIQIIKNNTIYFENNDEMRFVAKEHDEIAAEINLLMDMNE